MTKKIDLMMLFTGVGIHAQKQMKEERHISAPSHKDYSEQH